VNSITVAGHRRSSLGTEKGTGSTIFGEYPSLLENSFAASSAPGSVTEYAVLVVYWSRFRASLAPDRADDHFFNRLTPSTHSGEKGSPLGLFCYSFLLNIQCAIVNSSPTEAT
jgi:hypothetical protein